MLLPQWTEGRQLNKNKTLQHEQKQTAPLGATKHMKAMTNTNKEINTTLRLEKVRLGTRLGGVLALF